MASFLSAVAVLIAAVAAASGRSDGTNTHSSITQIRDTLRNLLRSIEDNGRDAEALFGKRQLWCETSIRDFSADEQAWTASLQDMQSQLTETQAEVEEAQGTVQQVKVDIEMVQHTIKQTDDMAKEHSAEGDRKADYSLLQSLAENKKLSLASLQGELEVAVPVLAQLQSNVAETKQRISFRIESLGVAKDFIVALKDSCQQCADRLDAQAAARVGESNSIHVALQGLDQASQSHSTGSGKDDELDAQAAQALSFVQVDHESEVTTDDLSDLFAANQDAHRFIAAHKALNKMAVASSLRPRIQTLLTQLQDVDNTASGLDQAAWCSKQRENSAMSLKFAQDSVSRISSELESHSDSEAELGEELTKLQAVATAVAASAKNVLEQASKEQALIQSSRKDQQLATKIIDQATTIIKDLGQSNGLADSSATPIIGLADSAKVVGALASAKNMLLAQIKAAEGFDKEASAKAMSVGQAALILTQTQESEQHNLELAKDDHSSQRLRGVENKRLYDTDVQDAMSYSQKIEDTCKVNADTWSNQQRSAQEHALEDADKALEGKLVELKSSGPGLRGSDASHATSPAANLTPMQRAAMEMGISSD